MYIVSSWCFLDVDFFYSNWSKNRSHWDVSWFSSFFLRDRRKKTLETCCFFFRGNLKGIIYLFFNYFIFAFIFNSNSVFDKCFLYQILIKWNKCFKKYYFWLFKFCWLLSFFRTWCITTLCRNAWLWLLYFVVSLVHTVSDVEVVCRPLVIKSPHLLLIQCVRGLTLKICAM